MAVGWRWGRHRSWVIDGAMDDLYGVQLATNDLCTAENVQRAGDEKGNKAREESVRGPGGSRLLRLVAWKAVI